ncbi:AGC protein kinase [Phytophthora cinnamomi]|uniref:AGC protein kinase n=1 Tax=Phytophthora cinnamomi TaxID=4785 RepID=UPI003559944B|nr:AGC protein kinase [Phytophthora cinnamomi]
MAAVLPPATLHGAELTVQTAEPLTGTKKRPLSPTRLLDEVPELSADDLQTPKQAAARPAIDGGSVSPKSEAVAAIDPHDLKLLKVIGRGTFARQVALASHSGSQSLYVVKTLDKSKLVQRKQVVHTLTEKKVLERLGGHPFIVKLYSAFQTDRDLNFVLEYCQGGELFYHLQQQFSQKFDESTTRFYAAEVLAALRELHANGVVYRDLKPENVLLDAQGHVKLADFGFAKQDMNPGQRTYSFCGSPEYLSPEMVRKDGHGMETDMWSFGCFIFELLTGSPPFQSDDMPRLFRMIQQGRVWYPPYLSGHALSLLRGLLCVNPAGRLTATQAMEHPFFKLSLNWDELMQRQVTPPIVPVCRSRDCTDNFDDDFTNAPVVSLKLQSGDLVKRLRRDDCPGPVARADEFQDF